MIVNLVGGLSISPRSLSTYRYIVISNMRRFSLLHVRSLRTITFSIITLISKMHNVRQSEFGSIEAAISIKDFMIDLCLSISDPISSSNLHDSNLQNFALSIKV